MPADRDQLAAAQNVGGARISKECTNRQAVYLASSHTHTHRQSRSSHTYTHRDSGITRALDRFAVWQKQLFSWMKPKWRRRRRRTIVCLSVRLCMSVCVCVTVCVLPSYLRAATKRERAPEHQRVRASRRERAHWSHEWNCRSSLALSLSRTLTHSLVCQRFQEQQLRAHTCQLAYSFARMPKSATVKLPCALSLRALSLSLFRSLALFGFI